MKNNMQVIGGLVLLWLVSTLSGCAPYIMKPAEVIKASPDYAVVIFLRPSSYGARAVYWNVNNSVSLWDRESLIGALPSNKLYIQYKATPGEHIFMAQDRNWSVVKANLQAGRTYFLMASPRFWGWTSHVSLEIPKPDDKRVDDWMASSKPIEVDPAQRDAYEKKWASTVHEVLTNVQNGKIEFAVMNPDDAR